MKPLLNHPPPQQQETLRSWLCRLALANYLYSPHPLLQLLSQAVPDTALTWQRMDAGIRDRRVFEALAGLTHTSAQTVYNHALHRFAHALVPPTVSPDWLHLPGETPVVLLPTHLNRSFYLANPRWCPACLAEARIVRLHWHIQPVTCCVQHKCWLQDTCPDCSAKVSEQDLVLGRCMTCGHSLDQIGAVSIQADEELLIWQTTLMAWLYKIETSEMGLPPVAVNTQLAVLRGLRYAAQRAGNSWTFHARPTSVPDADLHILKQRRLTVYESGSLYTTAFRGLLNWPHGFHAFLDAYRQRPGQVEPTGLRREFGALYSSWLNRFWKHPAFAFVHEAFNDYLVEHIPVFQLSCSSRIQDYPELRDRVGYLALNHTQSYLKISSWRVFRLVDEGHLTIHRFEEEPDGIWFARQQLDDLLERWQQQVPLRKVIEQLAISKEVVSDLLDAQLLQAVPDNVGLKRTGIHIYKNSLQALLDRLRNYTTIESCPPADHWVLCDVCVAHGGSVQLNVVELLQRILDGRLRAYHTQENLLPLGNMWFMPEDIASLAKNIKTEKCWLGKEEVRAYLKIRVHQLHQLMACDLLIPQRKFGRKQFFAEADVKLVDERFIFMTEAHEKLGIAYVSIARLVRLGLLCPLPYPACPKRRCYIFDRRAFESWHQQYILLPEMVRLTGDLDALLADLQSAHIQPVIAAPAVYHRKEVMPYLSD